MLIVMDGWGIRASKKDNAVKLAHTPNIDFIAKHYPAGILCASDGCVGLPKGQMGNSEVGHMNIGAGRVVGQELVIISKSIKNRSFFRNKALNDAFKKGNSVHIMGLLSDGGIHSHIEHLYALLKMARKYKKYVHLHAFLDGRDTPKRSALKYIKAVSKRLKGIGEIATISGRYYAMDRDRRWDRTEKAYNCIVLGQGTYSQDVFDGLNEAYRRGENDEFVQPTLTSLTYKGIYDGDSVIFFNFREDRARQLTNAFIEKEFLDFRREKKNVFFVEMVRYEKNDKTAVAFEQLSPPNVLGEIISQNKMKQLRIAETEKYAHVTFFFNGSRETPFPGESRILVPSPKVATYDLQPEMSAAKIKEEVIRSIKTKQYNLIILNFANPDMVGHSGMLDAAIKACETVDSCVGEIVKEMLAINGAAVIIADHGNAEEMAGPKATTHTTNPVPFMLVSNYRYKIKKRGALCNVAPTILKLLGVKRPKEMDSGML
ncbi:MAG: 2,3-bisphosphoglycerate-independent phosphoglycerate mutase [Nanoarchaeota archaeon]|nr:2,3-bisphosphoglycerate-independent phosphoglycerate mutase [Nanoarchaeota archaeon]